MDLCGDDNDDDVDDVDDDDCVCRHININFCV